MEEKKKEIRTQITLDAEAISEFMMYQIYTGGAGIAVLVLGAAAFGMLLFCQVPEEPAVAPGALPQAEGRLTDRLGVVVPFVLVFGFYFITEHGVMNWLVAYGTTGLEMTQAAASRYLSVFYGGVMLGRLVLSPLVDKLGVIRSMQLFGVISGVLYVAGSLGGAALMPLWAASGFFLSILYPTLVMSIRLYFPAQQVSGAAGTIISIASLADILFNVGFGRLVDLAGYRLSICVLPVSMVLFLITFLLFTRKCRPLKDQ